MFDNPLFLVLFRFMQSPLCRPLEATQQSELDSVLSEMKSKGTVLEKYSYLSSIKADNPTLFYAAMMTKPTDLLPVMYTPGVGEACKNWGKLSSKPEGLTLTLQDTETVEQKLKDYTEGRQIDAVVVTDGACTSLPCVMRQLSSPVSCHHERHLNSMRRYA